MILGPVGRTYMGGGPALASRRPGFTAKRCGFAARIHQISVTIRRSSPAMTMTPVVPLPPRPSGHPSRRAASGAGAIRAENAVGLRDRRSQHQKGARYRHSAGRRDEPGQDRARGHDRERQVDDGGARFAERKRHRRERYPDQRLSVHPIREPNKNPANIIAVEASSLITVRVRDINKSADVLDKHDLRRRQSRDRDQFRDLGARPSCLDQARTEAIADAKRKAEIYAKAAGVTLGRPLSISEGYISRPRTADDLPCAAPAAPCRSSPAKKKSGSTCQVSYELLR